MKLTTRILLAILLLAITVTIPSILPQHHIYGKMLQPMHIPVYLSAYIVGGPIAMVIGAVSPLLRHAWVGMPAMSVAIPMCFEMATYGMVTWVVYRISHHRGRSIVKSLLAGMLSGRVVWGIATYVMNKTPMATILTEGFVNALPGIMLQMFIVSLVIYGLKLVHKIK